MRSLLCLAFILSLFFASQDVTSIRASLKLQEAAWQPITNLSTPSIAKIVTFATSEQSRTHGGLTYTLINVDSGEKMYVPDGIDYRFKIDVKPQDESIATFQATVFDPLEDYLLLVSFERLPG